MWHLFLILFIGAAASLAIGATEPIWRKAVAVSAVHFVAFGALLFTLVWLVQLAQT